MKCPRCESTQLRKNGRSSGKQRYLCKACGKQFLEPLSLPQLSISETEAVQVASNGNSPSRVEEQGQHHFIQEAGEEECSTGDIAATISPPLAIPTNLRQQNETCERSPQGIAILLLDAENLKLDINAEKFLAGLCHYPLQVKIAFANWRNHTIGKQDAELYERGYQLIHVPGGQNSADAQMIAMGVSISRYYPDAKEVFVCSSDWLLTNLCNELQLQGITVYRVRRQDNSLSINNRNTGESRQYSLTVGTEIPSFEKFVEKIEELINAEHESITERLARLSTVTALFQERRNLTLNGHPSNGSSAADRNQDSPPPVVQPESTPPTFDKAAVEAKNAETNVSSLSIKNINSKEEFEQALVEIIASMKANSPLDKVSITKLSAALQLICGEPANSVVKKLKLGGNFTKFLQSCTTFKIENTGTKAEVTLSMSSFPDIKSPNDLEQWLVNILTTLTAKSSQKHISLEILGTEFNKQYRKPISAIIKGLNLDDSFLKFVQSCSAFKVEKKGAGYQVSLTQS
jgi:hypothetical protein